MMKHFLILLSFISSFALGQGARGLLPANSQSRTTPVTPVPVVESYIDNLATGTGLNKVNFVGAGWVQAADPSGSYLGYHHYNNTLNAYIEIQFSGFQFVYIGEYYPNKGKTSILIDGVAPHTIDPLAADTLDAYGSPLTQRPVYTSPILSDGTHTVRFTVTNKHSVGSNEYYTDFDALLVRKHDAGSTPNTAGDWFVGQLVGGASNGNNGTSASTPFLTLAKAAQVAQSGDVVVVLPGTYRETVTPNAGTIWKASNQATCIISGLDALGTSWTVHSGNIYKTTTSLKGPMFTEFQAGFDIDDPTKPYSNDVMLSQQIFKDGEMMVLAQYPKITNYQSLISNTSWGNRGNTGGGFGPTNLTDNSLSVFGAGALNGGLITIKGWFITRSRAITGQSGNTLTYVQTDGNQDFSFNYRVTNKLALLTQQKEWFYDGTTLYFWQQGGGSPTGVEYKARNWGFDLRGKSNVTIRGFSFIGCDPVMTTTASTNLLVDNIRAKFVNHGHLESHGGANGYQDTPVQTGSKILGSGSIIKHSEFDWSYGVMLWLGSNTKVDSCKFTNNNYSSFYSAPIKLSYVGTAGSNNVKILHSTFSGLGRSSFDPTGNQDHVNHTAIEYAYNDVSDFLKLSNDAGAIYLARETNLGTLHTSTESRFHHNWFHNEGGFQDGGYQAIGINVNGIYFDQGSGPIIDDHNVNYNWGSTDTGTRGGNYRTTFYTQTNYIEKGFQGPLSEHFNNTRASATPTGMGNPGVYHVYNNRFEKIRNEIALDKYYITNGATSYAGDVLNGISKFGGGWNSGSYAFDGTATFVGNGSGGGLDFRPTNGGTNVSKLIDKGIVQSPYTDNFIGAAPDIGAYEYNDPAPWVPGYVAVTYVP